MIDAPRLTRAKQVEHAARQQRLSQALRDNLRRRKEQSRARGPVEDRTQERAERTEGDNGESSA